MLPASTDTNTRLRISASSGYWSAEYLAAEAIKLRSNLDVRPGQVAAMLAIYDPRVGFNGAIIKQCFTTVKQSMTGKVLPLCLDKKIPAMSRYFYS